MFYIIDQILSKKILNPHRTNFLRIAFNHSKPIELILPKLSETAFYFRNLRAYPLK
jgi:hypothetical protein